MENYIISDPRYEAMKYRRCGNSGLTLAQYALRWILRRPEVTSVIVGASSPEQLSANLKAVGLR